MANTKPDLGDLISFGVDVDRRRLYFGDLSSGADEDSGSISTRSVELAVRALHRLAASAAGKPIELYMSSGGGDAYSMLRLHDEILNCPCQVKFYGGGLIASSATWIMAACDERYLYPNARVMVHDGSEEIGGNHTDVQIGAAETKRLQDSLYDLYAANSRMPREFWEDICQRDLWLSAEETIMLGLADKIVEPKRRGNLRKMRSAQLKKCPDESEIDALVKNLYARVNRHNVPKLELNKIADEPEDPVVVVDETT